MRKKQQDGNIVAYVLIGFVLLGLLAAVLSGGPEKDPMTVRMDKMAEMLIGDIKTIDAAIGECVQSYPGKVDANGDGNDDYNNLNTPFPVYADMSSGAGGDSLLNIKCPGAPSNNNDIFGGDLKKKLNLLNDTDYTITYFNDATEGVFINIVPWDVTDLWTEALSRANRHFAPCAFGIDGDQLFYFFKRRSTSVTAPEAGCPD